jgi:hypothetical protein
VSPTRTSRCWHERSAAPTLQRAVEHPPQAPVARTRFASTAQIPNTAAVIRYLTRVCPQRDIIDRVTQSQGDGQGVRSHTTRSDSVPVRNSGTIFSETNRNTNIASRGSAGGRLDKENQNLFQGKAKQQFRFSRSLEFAAWQSIQTVVEVHCVNRHHNFAALYPASPASRKTRDARQPAIHLVRQTHTSFSARLTATKATNARLS